ncbi:enoyl-CoA hydratase/isomerase family protein [Lentibacillus sp. CBA3610]|uniref:enoyl-CoA hydratase/isomerase family protein n=1 Tax=Lentibacillus sp. CBA3610 TaxID=2518176 RepID=UPI0026EDF69C|nr:enoyl-CoA hydratase/isomerase family protein [Lentibacillus sp. CBA3610]
MEKPIIASINGSVAGSGLQLALLADIRIASENARFGMTEINVGLPCIIGTTMFWEVMGKSKTTDLILTGRLLSAKEAKEYDLITRLVSDQHELQKKTWELALELASKPPVAVKANKDWFNRLSDENFQACMVYAKEAHTLSYSANEPQEMMEKFFAKSK